MFTALILFGTRPEVIKLAPVIRALGRRADRVRSVVVSSSQHVDLLRPHLELLRIDVHHDLQTMQIGQSPSSVLTRCLERMTALIERETPDVVIIQGDTTTALAGALAAFYARVPVAHVEAGLRTGNLASPFPEEAHRSLIARVARWHFAATRANARTLRAEGVSARDIFVVGNTVVDSVHAMLAKTQSSPAVDSLVDATRGQRRIVLTTHRRENFGAVMDTQLDTLRRFVERHPDVTLISPVHPNPAVRDAVSRRLLGGDRIHLTEPMSHGDFLWLVRRSWLIVSDSGGIQEEAPSLGKPLLVLRDTTERPEAFECGVARLAGHDPVQIEAMLEEAYADSGWVRLAGKARNPFGDGRAGERIASVILRSLEGRPLVTVRRDPGSVDAKGGGSKSAGAQVRDGGTDEGGDDAIVNESVVDGTADGLAGSSLPRVTIVLPAFNEERDLPELLARIRATLSSVLDYRVVVVDDGSDDKTGEVVRTLARTMPITLISHETNQGLGAAIRTGLRAAAELDGIVVTLDADNSQGPELIPVMVEQIFNGADVVIASRFQNGAAEVGVPWYRLVLSHGASLTLRALLGFSGVRDYSCGFRAYRLDTLRALIEAYGDNFVRERGFACMLELLINFRRLDAKVAEIPLVLRYDLKGGASKMRIWRTLTRYLVVVGGARRALAHKEESAAARTLRRASLQPGPCGPARGLTTTMRPSVA